jgi:hypothetical protein
MAGFYKKKSRELGIFDNDDDNRRIKAFQLLSRP